MTIEKSIQLGFDFSNATLLAGVSSFWLPADTYMRSLILLFVALFLFIEAHVSSLIGKNRRQMKATTYMVAVLSAILFVQAILTLPVIGLSYSWLTQLAGYSMVIASLGIVLEIFNIDIN